MLMLEEIRRNMYNARKANNENVQPPNVHSNVGTASIDGKVHAQQQQQQQQSDGSMAVTTVGTLRADADADCQPSSPAWKAAEPMTETPTRRTPPSPLSVSNSTVWAAPRKHNGGASVTSLGASDSEPRQISHHASSAACDAEIATHPGSSSSPSNSSSGSGSSPPNPRSLASPLGSRRSRLRLWDKAVEVEEEKPAVLLGELAETSITKYHSLADGAPLYRLLMVHRTASLMGAARASWAVPMSSDGCLKAYGDNQGETTFSDYEENDKDSESDADEGMGGHDGHDWHTSTSAESEQRCMEEDGDDNDNDDDDDDAGEEEEEEEATLYQAGSTCPALVERDSKRRKRKRRNARMMERPIRLKISPQIVAAVNAASEADADA